MALRGIGHRGISATGPLVVVDAAPASDRDRPEAPNTGTAFFPAFRFDEACFARGTIAVLHAIAREGIIAERRLRKEARCGLSGEERQELEC